jgi:hypothetical protein
MTRRHEVFTAEQLIQDLSNLDDLVSTVQDSRDDSFSGREKNSLFLSLFRVHGMTALADEKRTLLLSLFRIHGMTALADEKRTLSLSLCSGFTG